MYHHFFLHNSCWLVCQSVWWKKWPQITALDAQQCEHPPDNGCMLQPHFLNSCTHHQMTNSCCLDVLNFLIIRGWTLKIYHPYIILGCQYYELRYMEKFLVNIFMNYVRRTLQCWSLSLKHVRSEEEGGAIKRSLRWVGPSPFDMSEKRLMECKMIWAAGSSWKKGGK